MRSRGAQLWNEMNILAALSPLRSHSKQASYFKPDFLLCSPFETAAAAFLLLLGMLSETAFFREIIFPPLSVLKDCSQI